MRPLFDEDLLRDPEIHRAVEARRATESLHPRSRQPPMGWLITAVLIGVLLVMLIGLIRQGG